LIETRRLKVKCRQHRAGAPTPPCFFLCHADDSATKSAASQTLRKKNRSTARRGGTGSKYDFAGQAAAGHSVSSSSGQVRGAGCSTDMG
jgi:hypothetical protein